jgi:very-short-patch-repair endonuclease
MGMTARSVGNILSHRTPADTVDDLLASHLRINGVDGAQREFRFHPTRKWRFDFAFPSCKLAVECEGGIWTGGRHTRGVGYSKDLEKYNAAALEGWTVLRFTRAMVRSGDAIRSIQRFLGGSA